MPTNPSFGGFQMLPTQVQRDQIVQLQDWQGLERNLSGAAVNNMAFKLFTLKKSTHPLI